MLSPRHTTTKEERRSLTFHYHDNISSVIKSIHRHTSKASPRDKRGQLLIKQGGRLFHQSLQIKEEQHLI
eukprot:scaffold20516_cov71-Cyclotella_meneghiniana.AAC.1